ncbi:MAG TPA: hypothetical protein VFR13_05840 [Jiangellaceae bacterium]|nr:hypothetical protein [Jiangellaceae bacterium]
MTLAVDAGIVPHRHERLRFGLIERLEARKPETDAPDDRRPNLPPARAVKPQRNETSGL